MFNSFVRLLEVIQITMFNGFSWKTSLSCEAAGDAWSAGRASGQQLQTLGWSRLDSADEVSDQVPYG